MANLRPDVYIQSYKTLDIQALTGRGIQVLLCDIDNTLAPIGQTKCPPAVLQFFRQLKQAGITPVLFSNNTSSHIEEVLEGHGVENIASFCCKPLPFSLKKVMKAQNVQPEQTAILGDQIFTDLLCGKLSGITTVLTDPLSRQERNDTKLMRLLEKPVYRWLARHERFRRGEYYG